MDDKEFRKRVEQMLNPKFGEAGFIITGIEEDRYNKDWTIMLKRGLDAKEKDV